MGAGSPAPRPPPASPADARQPPAGRRAAAVGAGPGEHRRVNRGPFSSPLKKAAPLRHRPTPPAVPGNRSSTLRPRSLAGSRHFARSGSSVPGSVTQHHVAKAQPGGTCQGFVALHRKRPLAQSTDAPPASAAGLSHFLRAPAPSVRSPPSCRRRPGERLRSARHSDGLHSPTSSVWRPLSPHRSPRPPSRVLLTRAAARVRGGVSLRSDPISRWRGRG